MTQGIYLSPRGDSRCPRLRALSRACDCVLIFVLSRTDDAMTARHGRTPEALAVAMRSRAAAGDRVAQAAARVRERYRCGGSEFRQRIIVVWHDFSG